MHTCPGNCGRAVVRSRFSCAPCWGRLPFEVKHAITTTWDPRLAVPSPAHREAMGSASKWFRDNPL